MKGTDKIILGIDPGTNFMGYGVISCYRQSINYIDCGAVRLKGDNAGNKLKRIFIECETLIKKHRPNEFAVEAPFYGKNIQAMLKLGRAQGVSMAAALSHNIPIFEYAPKKVKQSITGKGAASKEMVAGMVMNLLKMKEIPDLLDATDGLAVALCHHFQNTGLDNGKDKKYGSWKSFLTDNQDRLA